MRNPGPGMTILVLCAGFFHSGGAAHGQQHFTNVTTGAGIYGQTGLGHAVAWCDMDNDGDQDLSFSNQDGTGFWLYENDGGGAFTDITGGAGLGGTYAYKILWAELTGDDYPDLVQRRSSSWLYQNDGDGTFTNITGGSGLSGTPRGVADFDNDGSNDLLTWYSDQLRVQTGNGDGTFAAPATVGSAPDCWTTVCFDYNRDDAIDIYVGTYGSSGANRLFRNEGGGGFTDVAAAAGVAWTGATHGLDAGDYDNDGWPDLYLGSYSSPGCKLYRNLGDGTFADVTGAGGVLGHADTRTVSFHDYDNDGFLDIFASHHDFYSYSNLMWHNLGDGTFEETGVRLGLSGEWIGDYFGVGWGDYDNDGDVDLFAAGHIDKYRLFRNDGCPGNSLVVELVGVESNRSGIGATAELYLCDRLLSRSVIAGSGRQDFHGLRLHFGMDDCIEADSLVITWPTGTIGRTGPIAANQFLTIVEATATDIAPAAAAATPLALQSAPNPFNPSAAISFVLGEPADVEIAIYDTRGRRVVTLPGGPLPAGPRTIYWNGRDDAERPVPAGVYFCRVDTGDRSVTARMILIR